MRAARGPSTPARTRLPGCRGGRGRPSSSRTRRPWRLAGVRRGRAAGRQTMFGRGGGGTGCRATRGILGRAMSGRAGTTFQFKNATALDIGGVRTVIDVGPQSDVRTVAGDIRIQTNTGNLRLIDDGAGTGNMCAGSDCTTAALNNAALVALSGN